MEQSLLSTASALVFLGLCLAGMWKMFEKAGYQGWEAIVPFYNIYVFFSLAWRSGFVCLLCLVPVVNVVVTVLTCWRLALAFGRGIFYGIGLFLLPPVFLMLLGFGEDRYLGVPEKMF